MRRLAVARGVAWRTLKNVFTNPSLFFPSLVFPLFFFTAFAGGLSRVGDVPAFDFPAAGAEMWVPLSLIGDDDIPHRRGLRWRSVIARLAPGVARAP